MKFRFVNSKFINSNIYICECKYYICNVTRMANCFVEILRYN